jgi:hypothetical protein
MTVEKRLLVPAMSLLCALLVFFAYPLWNQLESFRTPGGGVGVVENDR